ncbi:MAG TPA: glycoside hydrolase family 2 TIM barrel-domain containing protein [Candidatus Limiplasma sp.]|nr:glycoside hydrolase family 2 TIM barrel-domain containing protein [Candidatus Limiplasma sp.]HRX08183.1 glycoside hydrolase family 2 TIM barrel-domain containing protein [Candidatus Limiplasma sp.]
MRTSIRLNSGWRFALGDHAQAYFKGYDDGAWETVTLPHDWSVTLPFDQNCSSGTGYLPGGIGWYRKRFALKDIGDRRVMITFGGVYRHSRVWINSNYLGLRPFGYASFTYDITEFAVEGENVISVRCEHQELADSRWFTGNGIYRDVTLTLCEPAHFVQDGVFAYTAEADATHAQIRVTAEAAQDVDIHCVLTDPAGQAVAEGSDTLTVQSPMLWSPQTPTLYTLKVSALQNGKETDTVQIPFGIRTFRFDADKGFFLNGTNMKLRGVCLHHDAGVLGAAVPKTVWKRRLLKLKEAGVNAVRCSHNPPDPLFLDLCDELGFLVIDEAFDEWEGCKNKWWQGHNVYPPKLFGYSDAFPAWHRRDLTDLVRRDRNHPCVILWSIGNEIDYPNDPYVHPLFAQAEGNNDKNKPLQELRYNPDKPYIGRLTTVAKELAAIVKENDSTRPVTAALAMPEISNLIGFAQALDVVGYNYKEALYQEDHQTYPTHILVGSENRHEPQDWLAVKHNPFISGQFLWTGVDYLGECFGWPIRAAEPGLLDMAGYAKPLFGLRKALWTDALTVSLAVGSMEAFWEASYGWAGETGEMKDVLVLTNGDQATLLLNGQEIGRKPVDETCIAAFRVQYAPGELTAVCTKAGEVVTDTLVTPGAAETLQATVWSEAQDEMQQIEVSLLDHSGRIAATDDRKLTCAVIGDMRLMGIENGCATDLTSYASETRPTWRGRAIVYVRKTGKGKALLSVPGLPPISVPL